MDINEKLKKHGFYRDDSGNLCFEYTKKEKARIQEYLDLLKNMAIHPDYFDSFIVALTSMALIGLGDEYYNEIEIKKEIKEGRFDNLEIEDLENLFDKSRVEYFKAFSVFPVKSILFSLARLFFLSNNYEDSMDFLDNYIHFQESDKINLKAREHFYLYHLHMLGFKSIKQLDKEVKKMRSKLKRLIK